MRLTDLLRKYNVQFRTEGPHTRASWVQLQCPHCGGGRNRSKPYMGIHLTRFTVSCWACGFHNLYKTLSVLTGQSYTRIKAEIGDLVPQRDDDYRGNKGKFTPLEGIQDLLPIHRRYLKSRGFNPEQLQTLWKLKSTGLTYRLPWRLYIPIHLYGEEVSWTTRSLSEEGVRYISASPHEEAIPHRQLLYGADYARHAVIVVEGPVDAWRVGPGAVALFGSNFSPEQVARIAKFPVRVVCFDSESEAQRQARRLACRLSCLPGRTYRVELDAGDPGSASPKEIKQLRKFLR